MTFKMLSKDNCPWCDKAKQLLEEKGVPYRDFHYNEHPMIMLLMRKSSMTTVPQVWIDHPSGKPFYIGGYEDLVEWFEKQEELMT